MNKNMIFTLGLVVAVISGLIGIYYLIPGISHVLVSGDSTEPHFKHAIAFFALAVIGIIVSLVNRKKVSE